MNTEKIYKDHARYYDLTYADKDYKIEAGVIHKIIAKYKKSSGKELLDIACGSGNHLKHLSKYYSCTGSDINKGILDVARKKFPSLKFVQANMIDFKTNKQYDIITCLFSSIGYLKTRKSLAMAIKNFSKYLKTGGVLIIEPWFNKKDYKVGTSYLIVYKSDKIKIARLNISERKGNVSIMNMHYLIAESGKSVKHLVDKHEMGLFEINDVTKIMEKNNLETIYLKKGISGRGTYIGVKK